MDFNSKPGLLFVVATLLPLASFLFVILYFALRTALRSSKEGTGGASLYQALGGDTPAKWPAYLATLAIGLACVCSVIGSVGFLRDEHHLTELKQELAQTPQTQRAQRKELREQIHRTESRWKGDVEWVRLGPKPDED